MIFNTINFVLFFAVVNAAKAKAADNRAWLRAIEKAAEQIHDNPYMYQDGDALVILSYSGKTYRANGSCQCEAYAKGVPCWHRAAAKLVKRYNETAQRQAEQPAQPAAPVAWPMLPARSDAYYQRQRTARRFCISDRAY